MYKRGDTIQFITMFNARVGIVVSGPDEHNSYLVYVPDHPNPNRHSKCYYVHDLWIRTASPLISLAYTAEQVSEEIWSVNIKDQLDDIIN